MKRKADLWRLLAELQGDVGLLDELRKQNRRAENRVVGGSPEDLDWAALGYTIHNIYSLVENYFLRVAGFFENTPEAPSWHRDLVLRMTLEIEEVRPALLDRDLAERIDELRAFRHVFRNIYQTRLDPERVMLVQRRLASTLDAFVAAHRAFEGKLRAIAAGLKG